MRTLVFCIVMFVCATPASAANAPAIDIHPDTQISTTPGPGQYYGFSEAHGNGMVGYTFQLTQPMTITQVGWYDDGGNGLSRAYQVGLWQDLTGYFATGSTRTQLIGSPGTGLTIPAGAGATLNGAWRVVNLPSPLTLPPAWYQLGGLDTATTTDVIKYRQWSPPYPPTQPGMNIGQFFYGAQSPPNPTTFGSLNVNQFYLAPGVELGPMVFVVPEPSSAVLCALAAAGALMRRRRCA